MSYEIRIDGKAEVELSISLLNSSWDIERLLEALKEGLIDGFNPIYDLPTGNGDWEGDIRVEGKVVGRYRIGETSFSGEIDYCIDVIDSEEDVG